MEGLGMFILEKRGSRRDLLARHKSLIDGVAMGVRLCFQGKGSSLRLGISRNFSLELGTQRWHSCPGRCWSPHPQKHKEVALRDTGQGWHGSAGGRVGFGDLRELFQPERFQDSLNKIIYGAHKRDPSLDAGTGWAQPTGRGARGPDLKDKELLGHGLRSKTFPPLIILNCLINNGQNGEA